MLHWFRFVSATLTLFGLLDLVGFAHGWCFTFTWVVGCCFVLACGWCFMCLHRICLPFIVVLFRFAFGVTFGVCFLYCFKLICWLLPCGVLAFALLVCCSVTNWFGC